MSKKTTMVSLAQKYLEYRHKLGFKLKVEGQQLLKFAEYADQSGHRGPVTTELALRWAQLPKDAAPLYRARRLEVVRCFAKYQAIFDQHTEIPPYGFLGPAHQRIQPHIYSEKQVRELIKGAKELSPPGGLRPKTYTVLFGTLISTGLRISEALRLRQSDVDLERELLTVVETKFHKSRLVALHPSTCKKLQKYAHERDQCHPIPQSDAFFLSEHGVELKYSTVRGTFLSICNRFGWKSSGGRQRPRMYDLRHTFAYHRLLEWYRDGVDVDHAIAGLSTYMGHVKIADTYWYITGVPDLMQLAAKRFEQFAYTDTEETH